MRSRRLILPMSGLDGPLLRPRHDRTIDWLTASTAPTNAIASRH